MTLQNTNMEELEFQIGESGCNMMIRKLNYDVVIRSARPTKNAITVTSWKLPVGYKAHSLKYWQKDPIYFVLN